MLPVFELKVVSTGERILQQPSSLSLIEWQEYILPKVCRMKRKQSYWDTIQKGDVLAGWANYDSCKDLLTPEEIDRILKSEEGLDVIVVKQQKNFGIVLKQDGQTVVLKGEVKLFEPYRTVKTKHFNELGMVKGKDTACVKLWTDKYFKEMI